MGFVKERLSTTYTFAQTAYEKAMMPKVQTIEMPKPNPDDYTAQANDFARIGDKEKTLWQPYYYAAFSILKKGRTLMQQNQIAQLDEVAKEAQNYIDKAEALSPNNAEIYILKKMNHGLKMMVNPMERWQTEGQAAQNALNEARILGIPVIALVDTNTSFGQLQLIDYPVVANNESLLSVSYFLQLFNLSIRKLTSP